MQTLNLALEIQDVGLSLLEQHGELLEVCTILIFKQLVTLSKDTVQ
jgi:hypothetical protein